MTSLEFSSGEQPKIMPHEWVGIISFPSILLLTMNAEISMIATFTFVGIFLIIAKIVKKLKK